MKYKKKPVVVEAIQWDGDNEPELRGWCQFSPSLTFSGPPDERVLDVVTLEGCMRASVNDYIIRGVNGEYYPCKPDIFEKTYEVAE